MSSSLDIKSCPQWDSSKRTEWPTFSTNFESFITLNDAEELVSIAQDLINPSSKDHTISSSFTIGNEGEATQAEDAESSARTPEERYKNLSSDLKKLDTKLYHILVLKVKGPAHDTILHCQKSFVQAWVLLHAEYGATNTLRKTALITKLFGLVYDGNLDSFKASALDLISSILKADITIQDILTQCLLNALASDKFQGFKLMVAKELDDDEGATNPYDILNQICNVIEQTESTAKSTTSRYVQKPCNRCGGNHPTEDCYATKHVNGTLLDPSTKKKSKGKGKGKGKSKGKGKGKSNNNNNNSSQPSGGKLSDILGSMKANKVSLSLDDIKTAVGKATSLHTKTTPISNTTASSANTSTIDAQCKRIQEEQAIVSACIQSLHDITMEAAQSRDAALHDCLNECCSMPLAPQQPPCNHGTSIETPACVPVAPEGDDGNARVSQPAHQCLASGVSPNGSSNSNVSELSISDFSDDEVLLSLLSIPSSTPQKPAFDAEPSASGVQGLGQQQNSTIEVAEFADILERLLPPTALPDFSNNRSSSKSSDCISVLTGSDGNSSMSEDLVDQLLDLSSQGGSGDDSPPLHNVFDAPSNQPAIDTLAKRAKVLDSGSGEHLFDKLEVTNSQELIRVAGFRGEDPIVSSGTGNVSVLLNTNDEGVHDMEIKAHGIPGLPDDIISLAKLTEQGYTFYASPNECYLQSSDGFTQIPVRVENGVFMIDEIGDTKSAYVKSNQKKATWLELHKRLGHVSKEAMIKTLQNTYGIKCDIDEIEDFFCPTNLWLQQQR